MKVLVTNPPWPGAGYGSRSAVRWPHKRKDKHLEYPIYLAYVVAMLKEAGMDVKFLDGIIEELSIPEFAKEAAKILPRLIVLECSTPTINYDLQTTKALKEKIPDLFVLLIGSHPTYFHKDILQDNPAVDGICRGEFECTVRDVAVALSKRETLADIKGLSWRNGSDVVVNPDREYAPDLDEFPFPDRELVKTENYHTAQYGGKKGTFMVSSRGCPYACTFCLWPSTLVGKPFRPRTPKNVVDEMELLNERYGVDEVYFDDDTINLDMDRLKEICGLIKERNLKMKWITQCRVDFIDEELLYQMKSAGCDNIYFGVEGAQETIKIVKKGMTEEKVERAFKLCRKVGIRTQAFFILGMPGETIESMKKTVEFAKRLRPNNAQFAGAIPHPGTALYEECKKKGYLKANCWEDYAATNLIIETEDFTTADVEDMRIYAYKQFYFRPSFILETAARLKNLRELKRVARGTWSILSRVQWFQQPSNRSVRTALSTQV
jgi:radical SAM superfamily enzyme YgiQ (UPF0313 family)